RFLVGKAEGSGESGLVGQVADVVRVVRGEHNFDSAFLELRGKTVDGVVALVLFGRFVDGADDYRHLEAGYIVEDGLRVRDVIQDELQLEFVGQADGGLQIAGRFGRQHDGLFAFKIGEQ